MNYKLTKQAFFICASLIIFGCTNSTKTKFGNSVIKPDKGHITVKLDLAKDPVSIHDIGIIEDMDIISLDCEDVFDRIDKIIKYKDRIYIMDKGLTYSVFIFDTLGRHIKTIFRQGQGPEDYLLLTDILIDSVNSTLNIISRADKKILKFDLDGKQCLSVVRTPLEFSFLTEIPNGYAGYTQNNMYAEESYNVLTMSKKMKIQKSFFEIDKTWNSKQSDEKSVFSSYKNKVYYIKPMDFNVYSIESEEISLAYTFDLGDAAWPEHLKEWQNPNNIRDYLHSRVYNFRHFQETDNYLMVDYTYQGQAHFGIYDKNTKESYVAIPATNNGTYFIGFGSVMSFDETAIYTKIDAEDMKTMWDGKNEYNDFWPEHSEQIMRLREKFPSVDEDGNPYLIIYYLK